MRAFVRVCVNLSVCEGTEGGGGKEGKTSNLLKYLNPVLSAYYYKLCDWPRGTIAAGACFTVGFRNVVVALWLRVFFLRYMAHEIRRQFEYQCILGQFYYIRVNGNCTLTPCY